jgi:ATP-dependent DNA helicase RecG
VTFKAEVVADLGRAASQVGPKSVLSAAQVQVLEIASVGAQPPGADGPSGVKNKTRFRDQVVAPLLDAGLLEMTIPDKPRSSKQQYQATAAGLAALQAARRS